MGSLLLLQLQCMCIFATKAVPIDSEHCSLQSFAESADALFQITIHPWNLGQSSISSRAPHTTKPSTSRPALWAPVQWSPGSTLQNRSNILKRKARSTMDKPRPWVLSLSVEALGNPIETEDAAVNALASIKKTPAVVDPPDMPGNNKIMQPSKTAGWESLSEKLRRYGISEMFLWIVGGSIVILFAAAWSLVHFQGQIWWVLKHGLHGKHGSNDGAFYEYLEGNQWRTAELVHEDHYRREMLFRQTHDGTLVKKDTKSTSIRKAVKPAVVPSRVIAAAVAAPSLGDRIAQTLMPEKPVVWNAGGGDNDSSSGEDSDDQEMVDKIAEHAYKTVGAIANLGDEAEKARHGARTALKTKFREGTEKLGEMADAAGDAAEDALAAAQEALDDPGQALLDAVGNIDVQKGFKKAAAVANAMDDALDDVTQEADAMAEAAKSKLGNLGKLLGGKKDASKADGKQDASKPKPK